MKNGICKLCTVILVAATVLMSGCASYDKFAENMNGEMADLYSAAIDGSKKVVIEDSPNARKMNLNIKYRLATGGTTLQNEFTPPKLTGDVVYADSCDRLTFLVSLKNGDGGLIITNHFDFDNYERGSKRMFDQDVWKERGRSYSDKVTEIDVKNVKCLNARHNAGIN